MHNAHSKKLNYLKKTEKDEKSVVAECKKIHYIFYFLENRNAEWEEILYAHK